MQRRRKARAGCIRAAAVKAMSRYRHPPRAANGRGRTNRQKKAIVMVPWISDKRRIYNPESIIGALLLTILPVRGMTHSIFVTDLIFNNLY
jgi:hypothetical protein